MFKPAINKGKTISSDMSFCWKYYWTTDDVNDLDDVKVAMDSNGFFHTVFYDVRLPLIILANLN